jgi:hypothetical protein
MKTKIITTLTIIVSLVYAATAQDAATHLGNASGSYNSGDLEDARFELRQALNEVNRAIGEEILAILPENIGDMDRIPESDNVYGADMGFAGLSVSRDYQSEARNGSFSIVSDSPLLASISSLMSMSMFMAADPNQKRIKIDGYKALMSRDERDDGTYSYSLQMPFGNSLMTFECDSIAGEQEFVGMAESIPVGEIVEIAR